MKNYKLKKQTTKKGLQFFRHGFYHQLSVYSKILWEPFVSSSVNHFYALVTGNIAVLFFWIQSRNKKLHRNNLCNSILWISFARFRGTFHFCSWLPFLGLYDSTVAKATESAWASVKIGKFESILFLWIFWLHIGFQTFLAKAAFSEKYPTSIFLKLSIALSLQFFLNLYNLFKWKP